MRILLVIALLTLVTGGTAPGASADPGHYYAGGCGLAVANDASPDQSSGGPDQWNGLLWIDARPTTGGTRPLPAADHISVRCALGVDDVVVDDSALTATGQAHASMARWYGFRATSGAIISVGSYVEVAGRPASVHWRDTNRTPVTPEPVSKAVTDARDTVRNEVPTSAACSFAARQPGRYGPVTIDDEGDVYLYGTSDAHRWHDCGPTHGGTYDPLTYRFLFVNPYE